MAEGRKIRDKFKDTARRRRMGSHSLQLDKKEETAEQHECRPWETAGNAHSQ